MKIAYQEMLDEIVPEWRNMNSLEIIGALLDALSALTTAEER